MCRSYNAFLFSRELTFAIPGKTGMKNFRESLAPGNGFPTLGLCRLAPSTAYLIHFFTQSLSSLRITSHAIASCFAVVPRLCHLNLFSVWTLYLDLSCSLMPHIHLTVLISALWSATSFSYLTSLVSFPCNILLRSQLLYSLPLIISDISLLVSNGTNCLNLFHPIQILASTAVSASSCALTMSPK